MAMINITLRHVGRGSGHPHYATRSLSALVCGRGAHGGRKPQSTKIASNPQHHRGFEKHPTRAQHRSRRSVAYSTPVCTPRGNLSPAPPLAQCSRRTASTSDISTSTSTATATASSAIATGVRMQHLYAATGVMATPVVPSRKSMKNDSRRTLHNKDGPQQKSTPCTAAAPSAASALSCEETDATGTGDKARGSSVAGDRESLVLGLLGPRWSPYGRLARIDKPAGALLLLYPCWWGSALATPMGSFPNPSLLAIFATSAFVMRSAGCTINDMWDRDLDRKVARTEQRPLASGELNTAQAIIFLGGQLGLGLCGLMTLNVECIKLGFAAMPLVIIYPLMKRYTDWPQAVLGLTFNWGAIVGWTAVHGSVSWKHVLPLYAGGVCWTLVYDTLYGHQDKKDDRKLGIRSTALLFGENTKPFLAGFGTASVGLIGASGYAAELSWPFYAGTVMAAGHLARQIWSADLDDPEGLFRIFKSNHQFGALVFASIVAGHWQC